MKTLYFLLACALVAAPAHAEKVASILPGGCGLKEQISINVSFNTQVGSFAEAKTKFDERVKQMNDFAKQQNIEKFELQSMNYSVNSNYYNGAEKNYQMSGNMAFQLESADIAFKFAEFLEKQKLNVNLNSNAYRQGNCIN